jgi:C_GCAxxG_C_C family probable redox protein
MKKVETALACFNERFACSQAVLSAFAADFGLDRDTALRLAGGFGGGMGRMGEVCGAVTGAFMVLGLKYGQAKPEDIEAKEKSYAMVREFTNRFKSRNGSILCRELMDCNLSTPEGMQYALDHKLFITTCVDMVRSATEILEEML